MRFDPRFFERTPLMEGQVRKTLENSRKDLSIARRVDIPDVRFHYAYTSLIKAGITLLSHHGVRAKSVPGHQAKIIAHLARLLQDDAVGVMGDLMRSKRNMDLYAGGIEVTEKDCLEYLEFVESVVERTDSIVLGAPRPPEEDT